MTDPVTGALAKAGVKTTVALAKRVLSAANGTRSSVKVEREIAKLLAEEAGHRQRELEAAAIAEQVAPVLLELHDRHGWNDEPEEERPTEDDAVSAAVDLVRQARRAGSNRKREVLFHAFYMRFNPEFYKDGMGKMLWKIACDLEYPTMMALKDIVDLEAEGEVAREKMRRDGMGRQPLGGHVTYDSEVWPHLSRLEGPGLIMRDPGGKRSAAVFVTTLGHAFIRFALDEYRERGDTPEAVTEG